MKRFITKEELKNKNYSLSKIVGCKEKLQCFYNAQNQPYARYLNETFTALKMESIKQGRKKKKGYTWTELNALFIAIFRSLKAKNKNKRKRIRTDKSNLMQVYLKLFEFIQRERVFYV